MTNAGDLERRLRELQREHDNFRASALASLLFARDVLDDQIAAVSKASDDAGLPDWISYAEASKLANISPEAVRKRAERDEMKATLGLRSGVQRSAFLAAIELASKRRKKNSKR